MLQEALQVAIREVGVETIDRELATRVKAEHLDRLAALGLRGERLFPVPALLKHTPTLVGYYRLLLGISGKQYERRGFGRWLKAEHGDDVLPADEEVDAFCSELVGLGTQLLDGISEGLSAQLLHELTLLTLGAQLDGGYRTVIGQKGAEAVRGIIVHIIKERKPSGLAVTKRSIKYLNAAGRQMVVQFGADPDIQIYEIQAGGSKRPVLAIEVKSGADASNLLNRLGEAEKSHLKLSGRGIVRWTIVGVPLDEAQARQRSPSTDRFFVLTGLLPERGDAYEAFARDLVSYLVLRE